MDRLNIGRISSKKMDMLQDLSVDFSQLVKKYIKNLKKLSSKDQKAFGKLFGDFKDGLDDLSTNESVNEGVEPQIKKIAYFTGTRPEAVEDFVSKHSLNITKLLKYVEKGKLPQRMELVSALAGRPNNPNQKKIIKMFSESVNEAEEPEIITQLRKGGYQTLKDPQTGKKVKIDNYSSSAIVAVYDALKKDKVKEKFVNLPLLKMANVAFKAMK